MKINKDLVDATLMVSFIALILVATSEFQDLLAKEIIMGSLGIICVMAAALRIIEIRKAGKAPLEEYSNES